MTRLGSVFNWAGKLKKIKTASDSAKKEYLLFNKPLPPDNSRAMQKAEDLQI